jgi:hypothetical protein
MIDFFHNRYKKEGKVTLIEPSLAIINYRNVT